MNFFLNRLDFKTNSSAELEYINKHSPIKHSSYALATGGDTVSVCLGRIKEI